MLRERDQLPHFDVTTLDGRHIRYRDLWQHRNLVLVVIDPGQRQQAAAYASMLSARRDEFDRAETSVVVTSQAVTGLAASSVVIADRWGEIIHIDTVPSSDLRDFPSTDELLAWVQFARIQCPECPP